MRKKKSFFISFFIIIIFFTMLKSVIGWGFWGHEKINEMAVFCLPEEMQSLFKPNVQWLSKHATDPDKRRNFVKGEAPRHYIDIDHYGVFPYDSVPRKWKDAVNKFSEDTLQAYGIVPWYVEKLTYKLTEAFKEKNKNHILKIAADLGHYVADAHVPLHTTMNYNGQLTNQVGIHNFWESRVPELLGEHYNYWVGKAEYIEKPLKKIWQVVLESNSEVDSVLSLEKKLNENFTEERKFVMQTKGHQIIKVYSDEYTIAYNNLLNNMAERLLRSSIQDVASFWYTAWVNAGQPDLHDLKNENFQELNDSSKINYLEAKPIIQEK
jgi:S1/P1 Nuclease